ncbi:MAG TPA: DegV family protein [Acidimicrobiales bacterium]|nr:DegV family protein [Acidimicrobiales bacterium]
MTVRVVTDSACDVPESLAAELGVHIVPLTIRFRETEYVDRTDLTPAAFYAKLASSPDLPETAAPSPGAFEAAFRQALDEGADGIVCIDISSSLSATMQSARAAAGALGDAAEVAVLDSRSVSWGLGSQVVAAARAAAEGAALAEVVALVEDMVPRTRVYCALDTLDNLKKGGRIGGAQALLGTLLSIKPVIDVSSGEVEEAGKPRTRTKALRFLADRVAAHGQVENLAVMHGGAPDVEQFLELLAPICPREAIHVGEIGATIGAHAGPRVMGATFQVAG